MPAPNGSTGVRTIRWTTPIERSQGALRRAERSGLADAAMGHRSGVVVPDAVTMEG